MMSAMSQKPLRVGLIGAGGIVRGAHLNPGWKAVPNVELAAVCDIDRNTAEKLAGDFGIPEVFTDFNELVKLDLDCVDVCTPNRFHTPAVLAALNAGMHVLCEKPLAVTTAEVREMTEASRKAGVINMVNLSYRDWPAIQAVAAIVRDGEIGDVRHVEASYLQAWLASKIWGDWRTTPGWLWRLSERHGSRGVLGDVGVHIVDFATYPAGPIKTVFCQLKTFDKAPKNRIGEYRLDANDSAVLTVEFANGALGTIHTTRWSGGHANRLFLKISGTTGSVEIDSERSTASYRISVGPDLDKAVWKEVVCKPTPNNYARFINSVRTGKQDQPDFARGAEVQKILDAVLLSDAKGMPIKV